MSSTVWYFFGVLTGRWWQLLPSFLPSDGYSGGSDEYGIFLRAW